MIVEIITPYRAGKLRLVVTDDGAQRPTSAAAVAAAGVAVADADDAVAVDARLAEVEPRCARERALALLSYRDRTHAALVSRLIDDGYPEPVARTTTADLERVGLVDDERFAEAYAHALVTNRSLGRSRALRSMREAGVPADLAESALGGVTDEDAERERALVLARSESRKRGMTVDKLAARLARRGYRVSLALDVSRLALSEAGADDTGPCADADDVGHAL